MKDNALFLNTAGEVAIIAIFSGDEKIAEKEIPGRPDLSKNLSVEVEKLLSEAKIKKDEIEKILVFAGPGSFTGLRIGISFANAFAFGLSVPIFQTDRDGKIVSGPHKQLLPQYGAEPKITKPKNKN